MSLFHKPQLAFAKVDPLADGLGDDIQVEQTEEGHFRTQRATGHASCRWMGRDIDRRTKRSWFYLRFRRL